MYIMLPTQLRQVLGEKKGLLIIILQNFYELKARNIIGIAEKHGRQNLEDLRSA